MVHALCVPFFHRMEGHIDGSLFWLKKVLGSLHIFYSSLWFSVGIILDNYEVMTYRGKGGNREYEHNSMMHEMMKRLKLNKDS